MSDRPTSNANKPPEKRDSSESQRQPMSPGGWHTPRDEDTSGWHAPIEEESSGWRVPALPQDLPVVPEDKGTWHLPKPEDTRFSTGDQIEIITPTSDATASATGADTLSGLPFDDVPHRTRVVKNKAGAPDVTEETDSSKPLPFGPESGRASGQVDDTITPGLVYSDDDDDDTFSMSELIALASLVDEQGQAEASAAAAEPAAQPAAVTPTDPAEYARQQLEKLSATETSAPVESASTPATTDPAEYARQQLEKLGTSAPEPSPAAAPTAEPQVPAAPQLSPLGQKYRDTEENVRALRQQYQTGKMTREQLQSELRKHMVLDDNNVWWMLGVETDTWYKYEGGNWIAARPPALTPINEPRFDTEPSGDLDNGNTVPVGGGLRVDEDFMPLPRAVPVRDPDFTLPGTGGVYLPPMPSDLSVTQPMSGEQTMPMASLSGATIPGAALSGTGTDMAFGSRQVSVPSPTPLDDGSEPPSYDLKKPSPLYDQVNKRKRQSLTRALIILAVIAVALLFLLGACGIGAGILYYRSLASPYASQITALANYEPQFQTARILDAEGNQIVELTSREGGAREKVALRDISPFLIHAVIATENERFYDDPGWDAIAIGRAILQNAVSGDIQSGASTITQQIARNLILHDTTISTERKLQEIVIASEIAQRYDKDFILELYLNENFFGNRSYGVEAASQFYFQKSAADLNIAEAAMIAGLIQAPATYDPVVNRQAAFDRMATVLERMRRVGCLQFQHAPFQGEPFCISDDQIRLGPNGDLIGGEALVEKAHVETMEFRPREYTVNYPHFVNYVQAEIEQAFGSDEMFRRGFTVRTTLIPQIQDTAQNALSQYVTAAGNTGLDTGAVLVTDPMTGAIRAMVGSPDFNNENIDGQVNNVLTWQQPGSSIKPVVYSAALEGVPSNGGVAYWTPATIIWDVPTTYNTQPPYSPTNYDHRFHGPVALRYALDNSYNVPAVKAMEFIGIDKFRDIATRMGETFTDDAVFGLPTALGSTDVRLYDHVQAYATLANGGRHVPLFAITSITDANGNDVPLPQRPEPTQAIAPQIAFLMENILSDNNARADAFGLNSGLAIPGYDGMVGAKTGTTNGATDLWTMGFTTNAVVGVWTGTVDNHQTNATTATAAIPVFNTVMRAVLAINQPQPFPDPGGIVQVQICGATGTSYDPNQPCPNVRGELFAQSQPPPPSTQAFVQTAAVDTWSGLLANQFCPDNVETRSFINVTDPTAIQWLQTADGQAYAQALSLPQEVQALPSSQCDQNAQKPNIHIDTPGDGQQVTGQAEILGSVVANNFNRYQLEVASVNNPDLWTIVYGPQTTQMQPGSVIGTWDTTQIPNGIYRLRLSAFANDGGYVYRSVQVGVNNAAPTPTAAPIPTIDFGATPLSPFEITILTPTPGAVVQ